MAATSSNVVSLIDYQGAPSSAAPSKSVAKICRDFAKARQIRSPWEGKFDDCFRYAMPFRQNWFSQAEGSNATVDIFDETAVVAVQEFASRLQDGVVPNYSRWAELVAGVEVVEEERKEVDVALDEVTEYFFEVLNTSNFSMETHEAFLDLAVTLGALEVSEGDALNPLRFRALPIQNLWVMNGVYGGLDHFYTLKMLVLDELQVSYPGYTLSAAIEEEMGKDATKPYCFVEATCRDWSHANEEVWVRTLLCEKSQCEVWSETTKGIGSGPIIGFRWAKGAGETWGRGPLLNCLPAIKTVNMVVELVLENAQMAIAGLYTAEDDGIVNVDTIQLVPGTVIPVAPGGSLKRLDGAGNFNVADLILNDMRANIKRSLYNDMLGNPDKTPMSATEVAERMADLSRQIGSAYGRLLYEFVTRLVQRCVWILKKRGLIQLPVVNGRTVKVRSTSPLAQAQNAKDIQNIDRLVGFVQQRFGPQLANIFLKGEEIVPEVAKKLQVFAGATRSKVEMKALIEQLQGMAQQAGMIQGDAPPSVEGAPPVG